MKKVSAQEHYDLLIQEGNDPVYDPPNLQAYMCKWDGPPFIDALALAPDSHVLEIGVGTGRLAKMVLKTGCGHFTGIDISPATIARAKENLAAWQSISLICGDFIEYPFTQTFDVIYASLTLFHFENKRAFMQKAAKLLPKGRIVLSIPKVKEHAILFGSREVALYPDDLDVITSLAKEAGLTVCNTIDVEFAHILVAEKS